MLLPLRLAGACALLALLAAAPALAQTPPAPAPAAPAADPLPAPVPALPAPLPPIAPEKLATARQVVEASGMARSFDPMVRQLSEQIPVVVTRTRPELGKDVIAVVTELQPEFDKKQPEMLDIAARIYATHMSDADLKATAAFFDSPAGKSYVAAQPQMLDELVVAMQSWTQQMSTYMMKRVQQEMEKRGDKF